MENEINVESLAASFEYYFCDKALHNEDRKKEMRETREKHSVLVYPYSGAKKNMLYDYDGDDIMDESHGLGSDVRETSKQVSELIFRRYFLLSLVSMEQAQRDLLGC